MKDRTANLLGAVGLAVADLLEPDAPHTLTAGHDLAPMDSVVNVAELGQSPHIWAALALGVLLLILVLARKWPW